MVETGVLGSGVASRDTAARPRRNTIGVAKLQLIMPGFRVQRWRRDPMAAPDFGTFGVAKSFR